MTTVLLVIHIMIALALIAVVLLQRSEGGALGIGGGGGGFMTGRSAGNALTKTTAVLAAAFFATSLSLTLIARNTSTPTSIFNQAGDSGSGRGRVASRPRASVGASSAWELRQRQQLQPRRRHRKCRSRNSDKRFASDSLRVNCRDMRGLTRIDPDLPRNSAIRGWSGA